MPFIPEATKQVVHGKKCKNTKISLSNCPIHSITAVVGLFFLNFLIVNARVYRLGCKWMTALPTDTERI